MSDSFSTLPKETQVRIAAVAVLQAAGTNAGDNVLDTPLDALDPEKQYPAIAVATSTDRQTIARAGGIPAFEVTFSLHIGAGTVAALKTDAVQQCDQFAEQIRCALLQDPVFVRLFGPVTAVSEKKSAGKGNPRYIAMVEQTFTTTWCETYAPNFTSVLDVSGEPLAAARTVIGPLETIANTLQLPDSATGTVVLDTGGPVIDATVELPQS